MTLYHVTSADAVQSIWAHGLTTTPPDSDWVEQRRTMHRLLDEFGHHHHNNWQSREEALYFWPTHQAAYLYSGRHLHPAIVEVDGGSQTFWTVPNDPVEQLFNMTSKYLRGNAGNTVDALKDNDEIVEQARTVVRQARVWNGQRDDELEVWTQPPVGADAIVRIVDHEGEPFDVDSQ